MGIYFVFETLTTIRDKHRFSLHDWPIHLVFPLIHHKMIKFILKCAIFQKFCSSLRLRLIRTINEAAVCERRSGEMYLSNTRCILSPSLEHTLFSRSHAIVFCENGFICFKGCSITVGAGKRHCSDRIPQKMTEIKLRFWVFCHRQNSPNDICDTFSSIHLLIFVFDCLTFSAANFIIFSLGTVFKIRDWAAAHSAAQFILSSSSRSNLERKYLLFLKLFRAFS